MAYREHEQPLVDGNVGLSVVRVGQTVRRPARAWSASVDALLLHLEAAGYDRAPRALGYDDLGRQVLSYVNGYTDANPADLSQARLAELGRMIRDFHDAVESFVPPPDAVWNVAIAPDAEDLICHHDLAPWNLVRTNGRLVIVDWDGAGPGSRLWDLAYAAHGFVPLAPAAGLDETSAAHRLAALVDGYSLDERGRHQLLSLLARRVWSMHDLLETGHRTGTRPWSGLWEAGHGAVWAADARYVQERGALWQSAIVS
jgi:hypothetical protein